MQHQDYHSFDSHDLRFENEFKKLKLRAEYGIKLIENPTKNLQQEYEWLNNLEAFEACHADYNQIPVFVYIGEPSHFKPVHKLSKQKIVKELQALQTLLAENQIRVESLCELEDKELYRFIVEEVFWEEIPKNREPNHIKTFLYEEYHPNQAYEIKETIEDFFQRSFHQLWIRVEGQLCDRVQSQSRSSLKKRKVLSKLQDWVSLYEDIQLTDIQFSRIVTDQKQATAAAYISFEGLLPDTYELYHGRISANFQLRTEDMSLWQISGIFIPKIGL